MVIQSFTFSPNITGTFKRRKAYQTSHFLDKRCKTGIFSIINHRSEPRTSSSCTPRSTRSTGSQQGDAGYGRYTQGVVVGGIPGWVYQASSLPWWVYPVSSLPWWVSRLLTMVGIPPPDYGGYPSLLTMVGIPAS